MSEATPSFYCSIVLQSPFFLYIYITYQTPKTTVEKFMVEVMITPRSVGNPFSSREARNFGTFLVVVIADALTVSFLPLSSTNEQFQSSELKKSVFNGHGILIGV